MNFYRTALLTGAFLFFSVVMTWRESYGADCRKHSVYCHIQRVAPGTPNAMELSNKIVRVAKKYGVDPHVVVAIGMQESSLRVGTHRVKLVVDAFGCRMVVTDYGVLQVNQHSIPAYKLDSSKLLVSEDYQLESGVRILADKIKTFGHWSAYHSMTPRFNQMYRQAVGRYL